MEKNEVLNAMKKQGYHGTLEDRIPMFLLDSSQNPAKLKKALQDAGYQNSFGYKLVGKGSIPKDEDIDAMKDSTENAETLGISSSRESAEATSNMETVDLIDSMEKGTTTKRETASTQEIALEQESPEIEKRETDTDTDSASEDSVTNDFDKEEMDYEGESSLWSDSDDFFESSDGQMSFF